ncbi:MAG: AEC family transporter, partial [Firmicutes bacterium]|nr:AEC family transporter [Bacillota bacterium]
MFLTMLIGVFLKWKKMLTPEEVKKVNKFTFNVFYPFMTFTSIYGAELGEAVDVKLLAYTLIMVLVVFFVSTVVVMKIEPSNRSRGAMIQAIYRSNFVIMGMPVAANICGGDIAVTAFAVTVVVPVYNILAVTLLETFRGGKPDPLHILKGIAKNPLIIGAVLGLLTIPLG